MSTVNRVKIKSNGQSQDTEIWIDGVRMNNVTHLKLEIGVQDIMLATLTLTVYVDELDVDGELRTRNREVAKMTDAEALERALVLLGETATSELQRRLLEMLQKAAKEAGA